MSSGGQRNTCPDRRALVVDQEVLSGQLGRSGQLCDLRHDVAPCRGRSQDQLHPTPQGQAALASVETQNLHNLVGRCGDARSALDSHVVGPQRRNGWRPRDPAKPQAGSQGCGTSTGPRQFEGGRQRGGDAAPRQAGGDGDHPANLLVEKSPEVAQVAAVPPSHRAPAGVGERRAGRFHS